MPQKIKGENRKGEKKQVKDAGKEKKGPFEYLDQPVAFFVKTLRRFLFEQGGFTGQTEAGFRTFPVGFKECFDRIFNSLFDFWFLHI